MTTWIKASPQRDLGGGINTSEGWGGGKKGNREQQTAETARRELKQPAGPTGRGGACGSAEKAYRSVGIKHEGDGRDEAGEDLVLHLEDLGEAFKVISPLPWEQRLTLLWLD